MSDLHSESSPSRVRVADVVFDARVGGAAARYTYATLIPVEAGDLVLAPLSGRPLAGVVVNVYEAGASDLGFPVEKLRPISEKIEGAGLPRPLVEMASHIAEAYLCSFSSAIGPALPPGIADRVVTEWMLDEEALKEHFLALTALQTEIIATIRESIGPYRVPKTLSSPLRKALKLLEAKGIAIKSTRLRPIEADSVERRLYRLTSDEARIDAYLHEHAKKRPAQALVLIKLREVHLGALGVDDIRALGGVTHQVVKALLDAGLLEEVEPDSRPPHPAPTPNSEQGRAIREIVAAIEKENPLGFLLFGVTGSGKTEVYLRAASEALRAGKQVLYLVPEIALATQAIGQLRDRFGGRVAVLHSELSPKERLANWMRIAHGEAPIVIGARSALFAPLANLGLIVMDEEHEASFKQESLPRYHAKNLVRFLAEKHRCPYVLGSATPSVETYYESEQGHLVRLELKNRAADAQLPTVEVEDLGFGFRSGQPALLTHTLEEYLAETVAEGHQAILFLNRRAYSPFLICRECGHFFMCPQCAVTLSYSRRDQKMRCHHCGYQAPPPDACPSCLGSRISPVGVGTEKVEEAVQSVLPEAKVARLDRDIASRKGALETILAEFGAGETDVLVGTQIVAKGLNFPNVTLVGVIAADVSLNLPDFRAAERTFQLLSQVAGRAGRGDLSGRVVIQTFNPSHIAVQCARAHDYLRFYRETIREREESNYPPFTSLANITFAGTEFAAVVRLAETSARRLRDVLPEADVVGPSSCVIERVQNRWRWHILVKLPPQASPKPIADALESLECGKVQVTIDVDAYALM